MKTTFLTSEQIYANAMLGAMKQKQELIEAQELQIAQIHKKYRQIIGAMLIGFVICTLF